MRRLIGKLTGGARSEGEPIVFRIGLYLGDLIVDGDDLYGDGVNIAAQLEAESPPGGIVISGSIGIAPSPLPQRDRLRALNASALSNRASDRPEIAQPHCSGGRACRFSRQTWRPAGAVNDTSFSGVAVIANAGSSRQAGKKKRRRTTAADASPSTSMRRPPKRSSTARHILGVGVQEIVGRCSSGSRLRSARSASGFCG